MAYGDPVGPGYAEGTATSRLAARDLGRSATGSPSLVPYVQEVTHEITTITDGRLETVTAGTRVAFPSVACRRVLIQASDWNTGAVVIGAAATVVAAAGTFASPTRRGFALRNAGDWVEVNVPNLNVLGLDSIVSGEGVYYMVFA